MDQRQDRKPNPSAKPDQEPANTSATGGEDAPEPTGPDQAGTQSHDGTSRHGPSRYKNSIHNTSTGVPVERVNPLDEDTPRSPVGDPHNAKGKAND